MTDATTTEQQVSPSDAKLADGNVGDDLSAFSFQWYDDYQGWKSYAQANQAEVRQHLISNGVTSEKIRSRHSRQMNVPVFVMTVPRFGRYELDFKQSQQRNLTTMFPRPIRIVDASQPPHDDMEIDEVENEDEINDNDNVDDYDEVDESENKSAEVDILRRVPFETLDASERCAICLENFIATDRIVIPINCTGHFFHDMCPTLGMGLREYMEKSKQCPSCKKRYGVAIGNMPHGTMKVTKLSSSLPGFEGFGTIRIWFNFPGGRQGEDHPNPGKRYASDFREAYLPDTPEGNHVLALLHKAWKRKVLFTVGGSVTRGTSDCIVYNGIHFKTCPVSTHNNPYGYPDPTYLLRVTQELNDHGIM